MGWGSRAEVSGSATPNVVIVAHGATPFVRDVRFRENWVALSTVGSWPRAVRHWRPLTTHTRRMRFSGPLTGVLCKRPFPEFVAKIRIQRQRSSADIYRSCEQNCNRPAAFKNATVRERPRCGRLADVDLCASRMPELMRWAPAKLLAGRSQG